MESCDRRGGWEALRQWRVVIGEVDGRLYVSGESGTGEVDGRLYINGESWDIPQSILISYHDNQKSPVSVHIEQQTKFSQ